VPVATDPIASRLGVAQAGANEVVHDRHGFRPSHCTKCSTGDHDPYHHLPSNLARKHLDYL
jgi:hypothetical protein